MVSTQGSDQSRLPFPELLLRSWRSPLALLPSLDIKVGFGFFSAGLALKRSAAFHDARSLTQSRGVNHDSLFRDAILNRAGSAPVNDTSSQPQKSVPNDLITVDDGVWSLWLSAPVLAGTTGVI